MSLAEPSVSPPPRRRRRRVLIALAVLVVVAALLAVWLLRRGGKTVERPLVALLPADTAAAVQVHRLGDLLAAYDASPLAELIATDVEIGALLLSESEFRAWREAHAEAELRTHLDLGRDFLLTWLGHEVTLAFISAPGEPHPALVLITQADLGFTERLGELLLQLYPGARIQTTKHHGTLITTWLDEHPRDSLSVCRFGETIALSLRTDSTAYLRAIADAVHAETPPPQPVFPPPGAPGVHAWANPARVPDFLAALPSEDLTAWLGSPEGQAALALVGRLEEARLSHSLDHPREIRIELRARPGALPPLVAKGGWHDLTRRDTLAMAHFEEPTRWWRGIAAPFLDFSVEVDPDWSAERRLRHFARRAWRIRLGTWLRDEVAPLLDGPATLVIDGLVPRIGLPGVRATLAWETSDPAQLDQVIRALTHDVEKALLADIRPEHQPAWLLAPWVDREIEGHPFQTQETPLGRIGWAIVGHRLLMTLDDADDTVTTGLLRGWSDSLVDHPAHRAVTSLWGGAPRLAEIYLHAASLSELSTLFLFNPQIWTAAGQRHLRQVQMARALLARYPAAGLALQREGDTLRLVLAVAASGEARGH